MAPPSSSSSIMPVPLFLFSTRQDCSFPLLFRCSMYNTHGSAVDSCGDFGFAGEDFHVEHSGQLFRHLDAARRTLVLLVLRLHQCRIYNTEKNNNKTQEGYTHLDTNLASRIIFASPPLKSRAVPKHIKTTTFWQSEHVGKMFAPSVFRPQQNCSIQWRSVVSSPAVSWKNWKELFLKTWSQCQKRHWIDSALPQALYLRTVSISSGFIVGWKWQPGIQ